MKELYETPDMSIICFESEDIITASTTWETTKDPDAWNIDDEDIGEWD